MVEDQQGFTGRRSADTVKGLREGLVENQAPTLVRVVQPEAHQLQGPPGQHRRHVEHVVPGRGALVQLQEPLLHRGDFPQISSGGSGDAVQGDVDSEGPRVQAPPVQDQLGGSQQGALQAAHVEPDPARRGVSRT